MLLIIAICAGKRMIEKALDRKKVPITSMSLYANQAAAGGSPTKGSAGAGSGSANRQWDNSGWDDNEGELPVDDNDDGPAAAAIATGAFM